MSDPTDEDQVAPRGLHSLVTAARLRTGVRRYAMRVLESMGHPPLMRPGSSVGPRTLEVGLDPVRILVFGGGVAVGYGVGSRTDALDGHLARLVADATRRGVVLENRAVQHVRLQATAASLGAAGTLTFHVAVWCPSFAEGVELLRLRGWRSELHGMIRELRAEQRIPLVLTCMPVPTGLHPAVLIARPWVNRLNRVIAQVAAEWDDVVAVESEPFVPGEIGKPITGAPYFAAVAQRIAPAVLSQLRVPAAR